MMCRAKQNLWWDWTVKILKIYLWDKSSFYFSHLHQFICISAAPLATCLPLVGDCEDHISKTFSLSENTSHSAKNMFCRSIINKASAKYGGGITYFLHCKSLETSSQVTMSSKVSKSYYEEDPVKNYCIAHSSPLHPVQQKLIEETLKHTRVKQLWRW